MEKPQHVEKHILFLIGAIMFVLLAVGGIVTLVITGQVVDDNSVRSVSIIVEEKVSEVIINYETPAPYIVEERIEEGGRIKKEITVVSDASIHYENVIAYTELPNVDPSQVKIYWITEDLELEEKSDV